MAGENELSVKLTALGESFQSGINDALGSWTNLMGKMGSAPVSFAAVAGAGAAVGGALFGLAKMAADFGEELGKMSQQTGISVEDLSLLKFAAEQSETSLQTLASGVKYMQKNLVEASSGNKQAETAFRALGLSISELQKMSTTDQLLAMSEAIRDIQDPALRTKLAMETMGRGATDMLPFLLQGADGIAELMGRADEMGLKISTETAKQADEFNDSLAKLWLVIKDVGMDIGAVLLPPLQWLFEILAKITEYIKSAVTISFNNLRVLFDGISGAVLMAVRLIAELTDALHLTTDASKEVGKWQAAVAESFSESVKKSGESYNDLFNILSGTAHAQTTVNSAVKEHTNLTDEQRKAILNADAADKAAKEAEKKGLDEAKKALKDYTEELDRVLAYKKSVKRFDDEYFTAYRRKLETQGYNETQIAEMVTSEKKRLKESELQTVITVASLEEQAVRGVADTIKLIWSDTEVTFRDAWHNALNVFIDTLAQMVIQAIVASKIIQIEMAAATFGISLLLGMITMVFSGGRQKSKIELATQDFLRNIRESLKQFENEVLTSLEKLTQGSGGVHQLWQNITKDWDVFYTNYKTSLKGLKDASGGTGGMIEVTGTWTDMLSNLAGMKDLIIDRYKTEKDLINDVLDLLKSQKAFVRDIDEAIQDVSRSTFTKQELFSAQGQDIQDLLALVKIATGEERVELAKELKQAYLAYFETAKELYSGDELLAIQNDVVEGLEDVKDYGVAGYDQLIDINLEMLGVQKDGKDLQTQMVKMLEDMKYAMLTSLSTIEQIGELGEDGKIDFIELTGFLNTLAQQLNTLGLNIPEMAMAAGGIVTRPTLALIGEAGAEAVIPLERGGGYLGGIGTLQVVMPGIKDVRDMSENDWLGILRKARYAAQRLGRDGLNWGMA